MTRVDSFRYVDFATAKVMQAWMAREPKRSIPWAPLARPLSEARLAITSSAASRSRPTGRSMRTGSVAIRGGETPPTARSRPAPVPAR